MKIKGFIKNLSNFQRITYLILTIVIVFLLSIGIPSIARFNNRVTLADAIVWDGTVAISYNSGTGTENDPYIISNGSEFAYFSNMLETNDYENTYFKLSNDIIINNGMFSYDEVNGIMYTVNNNAYYLDYYSNKYYDNINRYGNEIGTVNLFNSLNNFKGNFDGSLYRIYGLYITDELKQELALFTNLDGNISNLYVENALIYGGTYSALIASNANDSIIKNVMVEGYVIGKNTGITNIKSIDIASQTIDLTNSLKTDYIDLTNNIPFIGSEIVSTTLTGNYTVNDTNNSVTSISINGVPLTNGSFEIDLGTSILNNVSVVTETDSLSNITLTLTNLKYNINYKYAISSGIVGLANNVTLENVINKGYIYGYSVSSGLIATTMGLTNINRSYNLGNINGTYLATGLVGVVEKNTNNVTINKSYNSSDVNATNTGGVIGILNNNTGVVSISNVFNTSSNDINNIVSTTVNVINSYHTNSESVIGLKEGKFDDTTIDNLKNKNYVINNLLFNEFEDFNNLEINNENAWIFEEGNYPILYLDDINNPVANININNYKWNSLSTELNIIKLNNTVTFSIEAIDNIVGLSDIKYFISDAALTEQAVSEETDWLNYTDAITISNEGYHVIYAKVVSNNITSYLNSDILFIDLTNPTATISFNNNNYSDLRDTLSNNYVNDTVNVTVTASDALSLVSNIKYYISNEIMNIDSLNNLNDSDWLNYTDGISINEVGTYVVYAKIIDNCNNITYVNTDYIVFDGYTNSKLIVGKDESSYLNEQSNITSKSSITTDFTYSKTLSSLDNITHNLKSSILLPLGTKITLLDKITNKVYQYSITTSDDIFNYANSCNVSDLTCTKTATYPFTLFKEIGTTTTKLYTENNYLNNGIINERFSITLDFKNTNMISNYQNVEVYIELQNNANVIRSTLTSTLKKFNIYYNNVDADLYLTSDYNNSIINLNSSAKNDINISTGLTYKYIRSSKVIDTTYENKSIGLSIKLVDSNGNIVNKNYLKNIMFKVGNNEYQMETDNIVRINLKSGISSVDKTLSIIVSEDNLTLPNGNYYFKISNYVSYDGYYYNNLNNSIITIPAVVTNSKYNSAYSFDVIMDDDDKIVYKSNETSNMILNILHKSTLTSPNIRVSLYKKDKLTAYDQTYLIEDLSNYVSNVLNRYSTNVYYVTQNPLQYNNDPNTYNTFELDLITANFENTSYKLVFDLYDGEKKINSIEKTFIVK